MADKCYQCGNEIEQEFTDPRLCGMRIPSGIWRHSKVWQEHRAYPDWYLLKMLPGNNSERLGLKEGGK